MLSNACLKKRLVLGSYFILKKRKKNHFLAVVSWHSLQWAIPHIFNPIIKNTTVYQLRPKNSHVPISTNRNAIPTSKNNRPAIPAHFLHPCIISPRFSLLRNFEFIIVSFFYGFFLFRIIACHNRVHSYSQSFSKFIYCIS